MLKFLKKRKLKADVAKLERAVVEQLSIEFPDLAEKHQHWTLANFIVQNNPRQIQLLHMTTEIEYERLNKKRHNKDFRVDGLRIKNKKSGDFKPLPVLVYSNIVQFIEINFDQLIRTEFEISSVTKSELTTSKLQTNNPDFVTLNKILKNEPSDTKNKFELEDTFEIELEEKFYYTILDMEDGNYLAVNSRGSVFRLMHDHEQPAKKIARNISELNYSGYKSDLESLFEY